MYLSEERVLLLGGVGEVGLGPDHDAELLVVDLAVAVLVDGADHLVDLLVGHALVRDVGEDELELFRCDAAWKLRRFQPELYFSPNLADRQKKVGMAR